MSTLLNRRQLLARGAASLLLPGLASFGRGQIKQVGMDVPSGVFPFGAHIYREPSLALAQYEHDLPLLRKLGLNMVKIQEVWAANERRQGEVDLGRISKVLRLARENNLLVDFGVTMEVAPAWLWNKYPDAHMVFRSGEPLIDETQYVLPEDGKPGPCWHHPGARAAAVDFLGVLTRALAPFANICVWNVWQEVGLDPQASPADPTSISYSAHTLSAFRNWLRSRYQTLEGLNTAWQTYFAEWEEVQPPRRFQQVPSFIDWRFFMQDVYLADCIQWKADAIRANDHLHRPIMAHVARVDPIGSVDWAYAAKVDIFGGSFYPSWGERAPADPTPADHARAGVKAATSMWEIALTCDVLRGASGGHFWAAELQGGRAPGGLFPGRIPEPADIRRWVLMAVAGGARGICFWNHRDEILWSEAFGFGLLDMDSDSTQRATEAGNIGTAIQKRAARLFREGRCPDASIALVVNEDLRSFLSGSSASVSTFEENLRSLHRGLWRAGVQVDFVEISQINDGRYKTLLLINSLALSDLAIDALTTFVDSGGTIIAEAGTGMFTCNGMARNPVQSTRLDALFGATRAGFTALPAKEASVNVPARGSQLQGKGLLEGITIRAASFVETLAPTTASTILTDHQVVPAGTLNLVGRGQAILLGTLIGDDSDRTNATVLRRLVPGLTKQLGPANQLIRRLRVLGDIEAWFFINPTAESIRVSLPLGEYNSAIDLMTGEDLLSRPKPGFDGISSLMLSVNQYAVRCILPQSIR